MAEILQSFSVGPYVGQMVEVDGDMTSFLDELINTIIDSSEYEVDPEVLDSESKRAEQDLRAGLKEENKPLGVFCYMAGIEEVELADFCKDFMLRTELENRVFDCISENEGISVSEADIEDYKREYREQYFKALLTEPDFGDTELRKAILVKKVLRFLGENNTMVKKG